MTSYPASPVGEEPALGAGAHVAVLHVGGPQVHVALLIRHNVTQVTQAVHLPTPLAHTTRHRALQPDTGGHRGGGNTGVYHTMPWTCKSTHTKLNMAQSTGRRQKR